MDYSLYGKGELSIKFVTGDSNYITRKRTTRNFYKIRHSETGRCLFDFNKANLKTDAIKALIKYFITNNSTDNIDSIYIEGHTDSIGSDKRNLQLSLERCESVKDWLVMNNIISITALYIHPFGKSRPVATNSTAQGRSLNRRVEMIIFRKSEK